MDQNLSIFHEVVKLIKAQNQQVELKFKVTINEFYDRDYDDLTEFLNSNNIIELDIFGFKKKL